MDDLSYMQRAIDAEAVVGNLVRAAKRNDRELLADLANALTRVSAAEQSRDEALKRLAEVRARAEGIINRCHASADDHSVRQAYALALHDIWQRSTIANEATEKESGRG